MTEAATPSCPADRWIAGFDRPLRDSLRGAARRRTYVDSETVYCQGSEADGLYGLVAGRVSLVNDTAQGERHLQLIALPGDWFGEMSTLDRQSRQQDAMCHGPVVLLHLPMRDLERLARHRDASDSPPAHGAGVHARPGPASGGRACTRLGSNPGRHGGRSFGRDHERADRARRRRLPADS